MEIKFYGANCIKISTKTKDIIIDDNLASLGLKSPGKPDNAFLYTAKSLVPAKLATERFVVDGPGEFELGAIMIQGIATRSHLAEDPKDKSATLYKLVIDHTSVVVLGHVHPDVSEELIENIGMVDVLVVPVGGHGYTLDPGGALKIAHKIDPKILVPTHYADAGIKYEVEQETIERFITELKQEVEYEDSLKLKAGSIIESSVTKTIVLNRAS